MMLKQLLTAIVLFTSMLLSAQSNFETELDSIQDETQATKFIESHKSNRGQLFVFNKEKHKTQLAKDLFKMGKGGSKVFKTDIDKVHYKIVDKYEIPYYRVSYVFLDGTKKSFKDINDIRQKIIAKYNDGYRFKDLAKLYSMDNTANRGGDMGWVTHGDMAPEFEAEVIDMPHQTNEAFIVDIPEKQSYYVVVKTHDTKLIDEIKVLKVIEPIQ